MHEKIVIELHIWNITSQLWLIKAVLQINSNSVVSKEDKQTDKQNIYVKGEFQNSVVRLSFLCHITDIKIAWINPCIGTGP